MKKIKIIYFSAFILFGSVFFKEDCAAADGNDAKGFSLNPFYQEINVKGDQSRIPFSIIVTNNTPQTTVFRVSVLDFGTLDETGGVAFLGPMDNLKYSLASWVNLQNDTLVLDAGESKNIEGYVENRESLSPGGHYGAIFLKNEDDSNVSNSDQTVALDTSLASLLFVRKIGGEIYELKLAGREFSKMPFALSSSINLRFQNSGNVHVTPRGTALLVDPFGKVIKKGIINEQSLIILPETFRGLSVRLKDLAGAFFPGYYRLLISYRYDSKDDFVTDTSKFVYIPPMFVVAVIFLIVALTTVKIYWKKGNKIKRKKK